MGENQDIDDGSLSDDEKRLAAEGRKIGAIKLYRERTGAGLAEAKDQVDKWMLSNKYDDYQNSAPVEPEPTRPGCGVGVFLFGLTLSGLTWFVYSP